LVTQLKLQAVYTFQFMCKHTADNACYISQGMGVKDFRQLM